MASLFGSRQNLGSNPPGNVRVIAKIRDIANRERNSGNCSLKPWISVRKSQDASESVTLSFGDQSASQKESCQVHSCYGPEEGNDIIFTKEVMPLISRVFDGHSSSVVAYGAIGSGKTYTIQGSEEKPGLAILAMDEIISEAERLGKLVAISFYEIHQEQAYDLLSPERPAISVLEDARGRIQLKGLSRVPIKSTLEFRKIYLAGHSSRKSVQKTPTEPPRRSHKGLIILVTTPDDNSEASVGGKMNFLDFAGYEDPRRKSGDSSRILENNKLNKSLFTLQKVILALNANESRVPFRESKVTRMLQDSLGGINKLTIVACLNPFFCQDSIYMANLACRTYEGISQCIIDSTKKGKGSNKRVSVSSCKSGVTRSTSTSVKQQTNSSVHFLQKKVSGAASAVKGKKLFDEASQCKKSVEATLISSVASTVDPSMLEEESSTYTVASSKVASAKKEEEYCSVATKETSLEGEPSPLQEKSCSDATKEPLSEGEIFPLSVVTETEHTSNDASHKRDEAIHFVHNPMYSHCELFSNINCNAEASSFTTEGENVDKENSNLPINSGISPPISSRLKELSNSLKLLHSTPIPNKLRQEANLSSDDVVLGEHADIEPKTPIFRSATTLNERQYVDTPQEVSKTCYPGTKNSLVQEYLRFINSASKEELKGLKGIGEKRATYILELREESPEPFKNLDDLKGIGLSAKQIKRMLALK